MLIWINGAFGAGKTQTVHELRRRLADAHVADPELIGFALQKTLPSSTRGDFQDLPQWRRAVLETLRQADQAHPGPVLVPMTLVRDEYFDEIVGGLRGYGIDVRHYALVAAAPTLRARLRTRIEFVRTGGRRETWAMQQMQRCIAALAHERFATHVPNDDRTLDEVVEWIAADAGLELVRPRLTPTLLRLRRLTVGIRHIR